MEYAYTGPIDDPRGILLNFTGIEIPKDTQIVVFNRGGSQWWVSFKRPNKRMKRNLEGRSEYEVRGYLTFEIDIEKFNQLIFRLGPVLYTHFEEQRYAEFMKFVNPSGQYLEVTPGNMNHRRI